MKKIVSLLLASMLCLGCFAACAEELDLSGAEVATQVAKQIPEDAFVLPEEAMSATSTDIVEVTDEYISVTATGVTIRFDVAAAGAGYLCLTQDIMASISSYMRYDDPYSVLDVMVSNDINILALDLFTNGCYYVYQWEADGLSTLVNNLKDLRASDQNVVAEKLHSTAVVENYNGQTWIQALNQFYVTIVNGQYVVVEIDSDVPVADVPYFLNALTITAAP